MLDFNTAISMTQVLPGTLWQKILSCMSSDFLYLKKDHEILGIHSLQRFKY